MISSHWGEIKKVGEGGLNSLFSLERADAIPLVISKNKEFASTQKELIYSMSSVNQFSMAKRELGYQWEYLSDAEKKRIFSKWVPLCVEVDPETFGQFENQDLIPSAETVENWKTRFLSASWPVFYDNKSPEEEEKIEMSLFENNFDLSLQKITFLEKAIRESGDKGPLLHVMHGMSGGVEKSDLIKKMRNKMNPEQLAILKENLRVEYGLSGPEIDEQVTAIEKAKSTEELFRVAGFATLKEGSQLMPFLKDMKSLKNPNLELREGFVFSLDSNPVFFSENEFKRIIGVIEQIVEGISILSRNGLAHRDLKPLNILWKAENIDSESGQKKTIDTIKIIDLDPMVVSYLRSDSPICTHGYYLPEDSRNPEALEKGDLYSLGVIACDLMTEQFLWFGVNSSVPSLEAEQFRVADMSREDRYSYVKNLLFKLNLPTRSDYSNAAGKLIELIADLLGPGEFRPDVVTVRSRLDEIKKAAGF